MLPAARWSIRLSVASGCWSGSGTCEVMAAAICWGARVSVASLQYAQRVEGENRCAGGCVRCTPDVEAELPLFGMRLLYRLTIVQYATKNQDTTVGATDLKH